MTPPSPTSSLVRWTPLSLPLFSQLGQRLTTKWQATSLTVLMGMFAIRRVTGEETDYVGGAKITLGAGIPHFECTMVELRPHLQEQAQYDCICAEAGWKPDVIGVLELLSAATV